MGHAVFHFHFMQWHLIPGCPTLGDSNFDPLVHVATNTSTLLTFLFLETFQEKNL